jgi:hypothetical protein
VSDPRAIVGLVEQERMRHEEMARREQEVSEQTPAEGQTCSIHATAMIRADDPKGPFGWSCPLCDFEEAGGEYRRLYETLRDADSLIIERLHAERDAQAKRLAELEAENEKLSEQKAQLIIQAQSHKIEARAQRATVHEVNQAVSGATGEKGDWNGAVPVRDRIAELTERAEKAEAKVKEQAKCIAELEARFNRLTDVDKFRSSSDENAQAMEYENQLLERDERIAELEALIGERVACAECGDLVSPHGMYPATRDPQSSAICWACGPGNVLKERAEKAEAKVKELEEERTKLRDLLRYARGFVAQAEKHYQGVLITETIIRAQREKMDALLAECPKEGR